jgi:hypothetical protein
MFDTGTKALHPKVYTETTLDEARAVRGVFCPGVVMPCYWACHCAA